MPNSHGTSTRIARRLPNLSARDVSAGTLNFRSRVSAFRSRLAAPQPYSQPKLKIIISHTLPLVAVGLLGMLNGLPDYDVRVWSEELHRHYGSPSRAGASIVLSDERHAAEILADVDSDPPLIVLIGLKDSKDAATVVTSRAAARLSIDVDRQGVIHTVRRLGASLRATRDEDMAAQAPSNPASVPGNVATAPFNQESNALDAPRRGGLPPNALRRVCEHIEQHLAEKIGSGDLAAIADLSESHFSRAFKKSVGVAPHRYLAWRRIEAGARLIRDTAQPLAEISLAVGFSDQSHFTRTFVRLIGETPGAFRHRHR
jgi:AraC-like DNA-binding protein